MGITPHGGEDGNCDKQENNQNVVNHPDTRRRKRSLSQHQKQMRFLTGLAIGVGMLLAAIVLWAINRPILFNR